MFSAGIRQALKEQTPFYWAGLRGEKALQTEGEKHQSKLKNPKPLWGGSTAESPKKPELTALLGNVATRDPGDLLSNTK